MTAINPVCHDGHAPGRRLEVSRSRFSLLAPSGIDLMQSRASPINPLSGPRRAFPARTSLVETAESAIIDQTGVVPLKRWRANRAGRREASTVSDLVNQIAHDKSLQRFKTRRDGVPPPRDVFMAAVQTLVEPFVEEGWRYAKSGPHVTQRVGSVTTKLRFASSSLNVAGELVTLRASLMIGDRVHGNWRREQTNPRRDDNIVATPHLGHLLDPPRWLEWNLADSEERSSTIRDIQGTLRTTAGSYVANVTDVLTADDPDPVALVGLVDDVSLIEYFVRLGYGDETSPIIDTLLSRFVERGRSDFDQSVQQYRDEGLPDIAPLGEPAALAYLAVQFNLPVTT